MLDVLNAKTPVRRTVFLLQPLIHIEHRLVRQVSNRTGRNVVAGPVGNLELGKELLWVRELFAGQTGVGGPIVKWPHEPCGDRTKRTIRKCLERSDGESIVAEVGRDAKAAKKCAVIQ